jgi:surface polysaccharide O-acyltransferase-like enzyme
VEAVLLKNWYWAKKKAFKLSFIYMCMFSSNMKICGSLFTLVLGIIEVNERIESSQLNMKNSGFVIISYSNKSQEREYEKSKTTT